MSDTECWELLAYLKEALLSVDGREMMDILLDWQKGLSIELGYASACSLGFLLYLSNSEYFVANFFLPSEESRLMKNLMVLLCHESPEIRALTAMFNNVDATVDLAPVGRFLSSLLDHSLEDLFDRTRMNSFRSKHFARIKYRTLIFYSAALSSLELMVRGKHLSSFENGTTRPNGAEVGQ